MKTFGASLVAQLVKNLPAIRKTWVQFLGWEDPLEQGKGYPLHYSGLEKSMDSPWGQKESDMTERCAGYEGPRRSASERSWPSPKVKGSI